MGVVTGTRVALERVLAATLVALMALVFVTAAGPSAVAVSTVTTIDAGIGEDPQAIAISTDGSTAIVASDGSVQIIDTATNTVVRSISNEAFDPDGVRVVQFSAVPGTSSFLGTTGAGVILLDSTTLAWTSFDLPAVDAGTVTSLAISSDGETAWGISGESQGFNYALTTWDVASGSFTQNLPLTSWTTVDDNPPQIVVSPDDSTLYLLFPGVFDDSELLVFDVATNTVTAKISIDDDTTSLAMAPDGQNIFVTSSWNDTVLQYGPGGTGGYTVASVNDANQVTFTPNSEFAYVTSSDHVHMLSVQSLSEVEKFRAGPSPYGVAVTPDATRLYVTNNDDNGTVTVVDIPAITPASQQVTAAAENTFSSSALVRSGFSTAPTSFFLTPGQTLPPGVSFNTATGQIFGVPLQPSAAQNFEIVAQSGAEYATANVTLAIDPEPVLVPDTQTRTAVTGTAFRSTPLTPQNFSATPTFGVSPALPSGLSLNTATGVVSGTPTLATPTTTYTITGTAGSDTASASLSLRVAPSLAPSHQSVTKDVSQRLSSAAIQTAGFPGAVSFSISPALPAGLSLDPATGRVSGTLTTAHRQLYTLTATGGGGSGTASLLVTVEPTLTALVGDVALTAGVAVDRPMFTASGFPGPVTYREPVGLPEGVRITADGRLVGTPNSASSRREYVVFGTSGRWLEAGRVAIQVAPALAPADQQLAVGVGQAVSTSAMNPIGFDAPVRYTIAPALPAGLRFNASTGRITGTAQSALAPRSYTITATAGGFRAESRATLRVGAVTPASQEITGDVGQNLASTPLRGRYFPSAVRYSVTPALPSWLTLDSRTGVLSGTPATITPRTTYTITARAGTARTAVTVAISIGQTSPTPSPSPDPESTSSPGDPTGSPSDPATDSPTAAPDASDSAAATGQVLWWVFGVIGAVVIAGAVGIFLATRARRIGGGP